MQKIVTHLWYDKGAVEAAQFYTLLFEDSKIVNVSKVNDTPSGSVEMVTINLSGQKVMLISAGPYFKFTPSISIRVDCNTKEEVMFLWEKLSDGGRVLMPLDSYPFSEKYGWTEDKYGLSWQIMYAADLSITQKFTPTLMFTGDQCGKAEEAIRYYATVFGNSTVGEILYYGEGEAPDTPGTIKHAAFMLEGQAFAAMDSANINEFSFNEAISFIVNCNTQEEIDYYWQKLSFFPEAEQCGWLKDKFGVSWQIVPTIMENMLHTEDPEKLQRVTQAFLKMKKFDISELIKAYEGL
jgi:predicted 3-demethylubiquinone-9 3-methyltransferase (glyoxalase superfamily)